MPISPTVSAWMQSAAQAQQGSTDADSLFHKSFQEQAFTTLRAKAAPLLPFVVTFKILDSNMDEGDAFGTFAISYGDELVFVPVVMTSGTMSSCEMAYIRGEDRIVPLIDSYMKDIANRNTSSLGSILTKDVRVEDTRTMFRNIIRPPASSNVVLASGRVSIADLPDKAKAQVVDYFKKHPQMLAKVGEFYPVGLLAEKLAYNGDNRPELPDSVTIKVTDLKKEAAQFLTDDEKEVLLRRGWLIKSARAEASIVVDPDSFGAEDENRLYEFRAQKNTCNNVITSGQLLRFKGSSFAYDHAILLGKSAVCPCDAVDILTKDKFCEGVSGAVIADMHAATKQDLLDAGFVSIDKLKSKLGSADNSSSSVYVYIAVPRRQGTWSWISRVWFNKQSGVVAKGENGDYIFLPNDWHGDRMTVSSAITYGSLCCTRDGCDRVLPKSALFKVIVNKNDNELTGCIPTMQALFDVMAASGRSLRVTRESGATSVTDLNTQKTASFKTEGDAAEWLSIAYGLSDSQAEKVLSRPTSLILTKFAAGMMAPQQPVPGLQQGMAPVQMAQPMPMQQPMSMPQGNVQVSVQGFNASAFEPFVNMQDPDMIDVGVLASFAGDPDVKSLLVDYTPDFITVMDRIGRVILLFNLQKKELEKYYRTDKLNSLLQDCRKVFRLIGELVQSLQVYINMS